MLEYETGKSGLKGENLLANSREEIGEEMGILDSGFTTKAFESIFPLSFFDAMVALQKFKNQNIKTLKSKASKITCHWAKYAIKYHKILRSNTIIILRRNPGSRMKLNNLFRRSW